MIDGTCGCGGAYAVKFRVSASSPMSNPGDPESRSALEPVDSRIPY